MSRSLSYLTLLLAFFVASKSLAQNTKYTVDAFGARQYFNEATIRGRVVDSLTRMPLPSAVVTVISSSHQYLGTVRNFVTGKQGEFSFTIHLGMDNRMEVSFLGYKLRTVELNPNEPDCNLGVVLMAEDSRLIDNVTVKARMEMYKTKGDTLIYLPRAVKTMQDDKALEIMRHMPGVEVSGSGIKVMGESVVHTYVNNKLIFGSDPMLALQQLDASEVASILSYDEVIDEEFIKHGNNARKQKVLNIITFKQFTQSFSATGVAEAGADLRKDVDGARATRYNVRGEGGFYNEKVQLAAKVGTGNRPASNNVGLKPGFQRTTDAEATVGLKGKGGTLDVNYLYNNLHTQNTTIGLQDYFPTKIFSSQQILDSLDAHQRSHNHNLLARYHYNTEKWSVNSIFSGALAGGRGTEERVQQTLQNEKPFSAIHRNTASQDDNTSFNGTLSGGRLFDSGNSLSINGSFAHSNERRDILRHELTLAQMQELENRIGTHSSGIGTQVKGGIAYSINCDRRGTISIGMNVEHSRKNDDIRATNLATNLPDSALSQQRVDKTTNWKPTLTYSLHRGKHFLLASANYTIANLSFHDKMYSTPADRRSYASPEVSLFYHYRPTAKQKIGVGLTNIFSPPNGSEISTRIDDRDPLQLQTGNPALKPNTLYSLSIDGNFLHRRSSFEFKAVGSIRTDAPLTERIFFEKNTVLEAYHNFVAPAGSTLHRQINGGNEYTAQAELKYKTRLTPLRCFLHTTLYYYYRNTEESLNELRARAHDHTASLNVALTTNFSSDFRITLSSLSEYRFFKNGIGLDDRVFREVVQANLRWEFLGRMYFSTSYATELYRRANAEMNLSNHILNMSLGCRVLNRKGSIALNAYDILNRDTAISLGQNVQYRYTKWQRMYTSYITCSFEYKFNKKQ